MCKKEPSYRRLRDTKRGDRAFVEIEGRRVYLGNYGSPESREEYHRVVADWCAGDAGVTKKNGELTVVELLARYWRHATQYYRRPDGSPTRTLENVRLALGPLREIFGHLPAAQFTPRTLKDLRRSLIHRGQCRNTINKTVGTIRRVFKWAASEEVIDVSVFEALQTVEGLRAGRSSARETPPVRPVPDSHISAVRPYVSQQVWAVIQLQLLTAARSGELLVMRAADLDMSGKIWVYSPTDHKTANHGHSRTIYLGPKAQKVIRPFLLTRPLNAYLFSPKDAVEERFRSRQAARKTPATHGNRPGTSRVAKPRRSPGDVYTTGTYRNAIQRACGRAGVPRWHPHQLRHNAATELRKEFGLEVARVILGHRSPAITEVYAELDREKAIEVMGTYG